MPKRTRVINDPADLVPLLRMFSSGTYKKALHELSTDWTTEQELEKLIGSDAGKSIEALQKCGLVESQWRMPEPGKTPDKEFHASYSRVQVNFQCGLDDLSDLIMIASAHEDSLQETTEKILDEVKSGNTSLTGLCRVLNREALFIKGVAKRSNELAVRGQRIELAEERRVA
ncbi:MAG: ArsR family transcriptional regulator [Methanosarcinales archaeon]|nr:MAG: ArsR family transcriptional regulator [Methanosarcinales archaeon]